MQKMKRNPNVQGLIRKSDQFREGLFSTKHLIHPFNKYLLDFEG